MGLGDRRSGGGDMNGTTPFEGVRRADGYVRHSRRVLSTKRWKVLRHIILERDDWACVQCGQRRGGLEVDHIEPVRDAPERAFDPMNLQTLCRKCHTAKTRIEAGHPPVNSSPARDAWEKAVADLVAETKPAIRRKSCWNQ